MKGLRCTTAGLWSVAALLLGHQLTYRIVFPNAVERAAILQHTGHEWTHLLWPAVVLFLVGAVVATVLDARGDRRGRSGAFAAHATVQAFAYLALEIAERSTHAGSWSAFRCEVMGHRTWMILLGGLVVQVVCALGAAVFARVVARLARARRSAATPRRVWRVQWDDLLVAVRLPRATRPRGPPAWRSFPSAPTHVCAR